MKVYPAIAGGDHTKTTAEKVVYSTVPPMGGRHAGVVQNCGVYDSEIPNETAVHSLEHGAVWITYKPDIPESDKLKLRQLVLAVPAHRLISPLSSQDANVILTAWTVPLKLNDLDDAKLENFMNKYGFDPANSGSTGKESKAPEFGYACDGGTGQPRS